MGLRVRRPSIILRGSSGSPKISRVGFEIIDISKDYINSVGTNADFTAGTVPVANASPTISIGSGNSIGYSIGSAGSIKGIEMAFEFSEHINNKDRRILIIFPIFSSSKFLNINLPNSIISSSKTSIIIIIFFRGSFRSFRLKNLNLLKTIFFSNQTSQSYKN